MISLFKKYPVVLALLLVLPINSIIFLKEGYQYCQKTYTGTVSQKSESVGRSSTYYLQIAFDSIPTQSLVVHPIEYSRYSIGDRFSTKSDFSILFGRNGTAYVPDDPQYKILNNLLFVLLNALFVTAISMALAILAIILIYHLNTKISQFLTKDVINEHPSR
jgi:hypothetical protein